SLSFRCSRAPRALHSFPTRRSSDLDSPVRLRCLPAHDMTGLPEGFFDTIVINSVVQYFPGAGYLTDVIGKALDLLVPGGALFLRSEEHMSELQSRGHLACRLLLEKK